MKELMIKVLELGKRFAELASKENVSSELSVIRVRYSEVLPEEIYNVTMGDIVVLVGMTESVQFMKPELLCEKYLSDFIHEFSYNLDSLNRALPIIQEKHRYQEVDRLQKKLEELLQVA